MTPRHWHSRPAIPKGDRSPAQCPELEAAREGLDADEAVSNPKEAVAEFLDTADVEEIAQRSSRDVRVVTFELEVP